ncbi:hypothetical protein BOTBODRAFT_179304 [Botryobasidium botryosum FD-172 SS1]|uniref:Secreted protein n=1 Tax=Botryobasidium botryosum (strain FD-172 SS1) TaxID=930990 RepID=A0A067M066_BOTB1|nr:hypothetical protein BOTBODRAFT_179304 [Botryobasidium botryosum FD-172 SS1]
MRTFTRISTTLSALLVVSLAPGLAKVVCNVETFGGTPGNTALTSCLSTYRTNNWDGKNCGGVGWFKGSRAYSSPANCYDSCFNCIQSKFMPSTTHLNSGADLYRRSYHADSINAGATSVECDDYAVLAECWIGYH